MVLNGLELASLLLRYRDLLTRVSGLPNHSFLTAGMLTNHDCRARNDTSSFFGVEGVTEDVQSVYEPYKREIYDNDRDNDRDSDHYELPRFNRPVQATSPDSPTIDYYGQASSSQQNASDLVAEPYAPPRARLASRSRSPPYAGKGKQRAGGPRLEGRSESHRGPRATCGSRRPQGSIRHGEKVEPRRRPAPEEDPRLEH